jgi:uncharacterized OsmC-like protein
MKTSTKTKNLVNGLDLDRLSATAAAIQADPAKGQTRWNVTTRWAGGTRTDTSVTSCEIGGQRIAKDFTIRSDEPVELLGNNLFPNPQEILLAGLNACMTVGYVAAFALEGVEVEELSIETDGEIDLRGFLGLDDQVKPGYDSIRYIVRVKSDATPAQLAKVHDVVTRTSPNYFNLAQPIQLNSRIVKA